MDIEGNLNILVSTLKMLDGAMSGFGNYSCGLQENNLNLKISVVGNVPMPASGLSTYAQVVDYVVEINKNLRRRRPFSVHIPTAVQNVEACCRRS